MKCLWWPKAFKSYNDLVFASVTVTNPPDEVTIGTTLRTLKPTTNISGLLPDNIYEWLSSGFNIVVSVVKSDRFVCSW